MNHNALRYSLRQATGYLVLALTGLYILAAALIPGAQENAATYAVLLAGLALFTFIDRYRGYVREEAIRAEFAREAEKYADHRLATLEGHKARLAEIQAEAAERRSVRSA